MGYALDRSGVVTPLLVPGVGSTGHTNLASAAGGHLRAWVTPYWHSSVSYQDGGGPGVDSPLFELDAVAGASRVPVWTLQASADGTALVLVAQTDSGPAQLLLAPIAWPANTAHLVQFNFGPQGSTLILDGQLAAQGPGTLSIPPPVARLVVGSTADGTCSFGGAVDEVFSLDSPLALEDALFYWRATSGSATLGPMVVAPRATASSRFGVGMNDLSPPTGGGDDSSDEGSGFPGGPY